MRGDGAAHSAGFTAGLMHDIGRIAMAQIDPDRYRKVAGRVRSGVEAIEAERDIFGSDHCEWGADVARAWAVPEDIVGAIGGHHGAPPRELTDEQTEEQTGELARAIEQAHAVLRAVGIGNGLQPPDVEPLYPDLRNARTVREQIVLNRKQTACNSCHRKIDPMGFAFENFDAIGAWRDLDGRFPIDPSGQLPDGRSFNGPKELIAILKGEETFVRSLIEKMLTFALGRGLEYYDRCAVDNIYAELAADEYRFTVLVQAIVMSDAFQMRNLKEDNS